MGFKSYLVTLSPFPLRLLFEPTILYAEIDRLPKVPSASRPVGVAGAANIVSWRLVGANLREIPDQLVCRRIGIQQPIRLFSTESRQTLLKNT
jgi:hypothetical protein